MMAILIPLDMFSGRVSRKTLNDYFTQERFALHPMCWNEGENLIIVDFAIADNYLSKAVI